jgi:hypothetical protein
MLDVIIEKAKDAYTVIEKFAWETGNNPGFYGQNNIAHFIWFALAARAMTKPFDLANDRIEQHNQRVLTTKRREIPGYLIVPALLISLISYRESFMQPGISDKEQLEWAMSCFGVVYGTNSKDIHGYFKQKVGNLIEKLGSADRELNFE